MHRRRVREAPGRRGGGDGRAEELGLGRILPDISLVSGTDVCTADSQANNHFACFREDGTRYQGVPTTKGDKIGDNVNLGPALSTMRIVLGYDRLLLDNLTAGVRVGFAFNGAPAGADFLPLHVEVRGAYWLGKDPLRPAGGASLRFRLRRLGSGRHEGEREVLEDGRPVGTTTQQPLEQMQPPVEPRR